MKWREWLPEEDRDILRKSGAVALALTILFALFVFAYTSLFP